MAEAADPCNQALGKPLNLVFRAYCYYFPEISVIQGVVIMRRVMNSVVFSALLAGTVAPNGAVKVSIRLGDKGANGTGRLSGQTDAGTWHGAGANTTCAGRWEAEKR
jgi:hypothetical protein